MALQHLRASTADKRPTPGAMADGQLAMNTNLASPGLFFKDSNGDLVKTGPVHVGTTAPNATPASGGQAGNSKGELWLDTTGNDYTLKTWDGSAWREIVVTSTMIKDGTIVNADVNASAAIVDTKLATIATAGKVSNSATTATNANTASAIVARDASGNFSAGTVTASLTGAASLNVLKAGDTMTGVLAVTAGTAALPAVTPSGDPNTGLYSPGADQLAISTNGTGRLTVGTTAVTSTLPVDVPLGAVGTPSITFTGDLNTGIYSPAADTIAFAEGGVEAMRIDSSGRVGIGTSSPSTLLDLSSSTNTYQTIQSTTSNANALTYYKNSAAVSSGFFVGFNADEEALLWQSENNVIRLGTNNTERARIDSSGRLLVGTSTSVSNVFEGALQIVGTEDSFITATRYSSAAGGAPAIVLGRSKSATKGTNTIVASGDTLGIIFFSGANGTSFNRAANIAAFVDGTPGESGDMPGRLVFSTTADGASSPTERMRINEKGALKATTNSGTYVSSTGIFHELIGNHTGEATVILKSFSGSYDRPVVEVDCVRAANSAYSHIQAYSGGFADTEFLLRGDGNGLCDGAWTGGGADYAEYFEWSDGNPDVEDRRGISVVLDGAQIRLAADGEDPIGVISGNPSVVGDSAWNKWSGKHLRDEFGSYLLDENGDRQQNPAYDPDQEYVPREQRPEWDCVGLMGKLRIRKGQVTGSRWIKMRDISDSVEEWLVR